MLALAVIFKPQQCRRFHTGDGVCLPRRDSIDYSLAGGFIVLRLSHIASVGAALVAGFLALSTANAESASRDTSSDYCATDVFAKSLRDQTSGKTEPPDVSVLGYARPARSNAAATRWFPQPLPAVDGINAKIDGFGGGANHSNGFYGTTGSLSYPSDKGCLVLRLRV
jgi:hypothetical protein